MSERRTVTSAPRSEEHTSELQSQSNLVCRIIRSEEHTSELQSQSNLVCRLLLEKKKTPRRSRPETCTQRTQRCWVDDARSRMCAQYIAPHPDVRRALSQIDNVALYVHHHYYDAPISVR